MSAAYYRRITAGAALFRHPTIPTPPTHLAVTLSFSSSPREPRRISLTSSSSNRCPWLIEAVPVGPRGPVQSETNSNERDETKESVRSEVTKAEVAAAAAVTVVLGVGNRVLYKLALVPLKHYPFFLAQLATFGYVLVYFSILHLRYHAGLVTDEMLSLPKTPYIVVGILEALGAVSGMAAGAILSGAAIPILSQSFLVWQLLLSSIFLGRRYRFNQLVGCFLVAAGVVVTVASGSSTGSLVEAGIFWSILMIVSFLFQAADTILKGTLIYS